jgi:hypothetical protein
MLQQKSALRIPGYCALCRSRCGCISVVENDHLIAVEANPSHPTGTALCSKGHAAPSLSSSIPAKPGWPTRPTSLEKSGGGC